MVNSPSPFEERLSILWRILETLTKSESLVQEPELENIRRQVQILYNAGLSQGEVNVQSIIEIQDDLNLFFEIANGKTDSTLQKLKREFSKIPYPKGRN